MNIASAELLQNSLQNLGNTALRGRQLDAENAFRMSTLDEAKRRTAVDQSFRDEQLQHMKNMEEAQSRRADVAAKGTEEAYINDDGNWSHIRGPVGTVDALKEAKPDATFQVNPPTKLPPHSMRVGSTGIALTGYFDDPADATTIGQNLATAYQNAAQALPGVGLNNGKKGAVQTMLETASKLNAQADELEDDDPEQAAALRQQAKAMSDNTPAALKSATAARPNETTQSIKTDPYTGRSATNTTTRSYSPAPVYPSVAAPAPAQSPAPALATNEVLRDVGNGKTAVFNKQTKQFLRYAN